MGLDLQQPSAHCSLVEILTDYAPGKATDPLSDPIAMKGERFIPIGAPVPSGPSGSYQLLVPVEALQRATYISSRFLTPCNIVALSDLQQRLGVLAGGVPSLTASSPEEQGEAELNALRALAQRQPAGTAAPQRRPLPEFVAQMLQQDPGIAVAYEHRVIMRGYMREMLIGGVSLCIRFDGKLALKDFPHIPFPLIVGGGQMREDGTHRDAPQNVKEIAPSTWEQILEDYDDFQKEKEKEAAEAEEALVAPGTQ